MKISYNWLAQYLERMPYSPEELSDKLTMCGIEVEGVERKGVVPAGVIVAEILERKPHPNADKLSVCSVSDGKSTLQIVCGAPNCDAGKKVALATLGTVFEGGEKPFTIAKCKLRGVESHGMLCSERELGLGDGHDGIMILPGDAVVGRPLGELLKSDVVYELEITPNRPDCLSHWGVAREISALSGAALKFPEILVPSGAEVPREKSGGLVEVRDFGLCPKYTARVIRNVRVAESPDWLKDRISSVGLRPINNIVDITNFVLMELGQPLHAFDLERLAGPRIVVRRASAGEKIMTLDGQERELGTENLVIADAEKPVALAGVMGGEHSGVEESTVSVLLESAYFDPKNIRSTSRKLGISSDSSHRFERGVDWDMVEKASDRATDLILELAGGEIVTGLIDAKGKAPARKNISCRFDKLRGLLGLNISNDDIVSIFKSLGLDVSDIGADTCVVTPPLFRGDLEREADLGEEVARVHGLDRIPVEPVRAVCPSSFSEDSYAAGQRARGHLVALGLSECLNYSFADEKSALLDDRFRREDLVEMANPTSKDFAFMRPSLFAGMLAVVERNVARKNYDLALFETGVVFCKNPKLFPEERKECCAAITGRRHPERYSAERAEVCDFHDMKGLMESWMEAAKIRDIAFRPAESGMFERGACAEMTIGGKHAALFGEVSRKHTAKLKTQNPIFVAVVQLDLILARREDRILFRPFSQYPPVTRDIAFLADESLSHGEAIEFIRKTGLENLESVELFDIFRDEKGMGGGKKSMAYTLTFRNNERTLTDEEVNAAYEKARSALESGLKVTLR